MFLVMSLVRFILCFGHLERQLIVVLSHSCPDQYAVEGSNQSPAKASFSMHIFHHNLRHGLCHYQGSSHKPFQPPIRCCMAVSMELH